MMAYTLIMTAQAEAGDCDAAEKTAVLKGFNVLGNIAYCRERGGDLVGALEYQKRAGGNTRALQSIARLQTEAGDERAALARAAEETSTSVQAATLLGVVEGRLKRKEAAKK